MSAIRSWWKRLSLRQQLQLSITAAAALALLVLGTWASNKGRQVVERERLALLQSAAVHLADMLVTGLNQRQREIALLANLPDIRDPLVSPETKRALLDELKRIYPLYAWIGLTDRQGRIIAGSNGLLEGQSVAKRSWFLQGLRGPYVGDVHDAVLLAKLLPKPEFDPLPLRLADISHPVKDTHGNVIGVLCGHLSWDWSFLVRNTLAQNLGLTQTGEIDLFVLNQLGHVLVGTSTVPPSSRVLAFESVELAMLGLTGAQVEQWPDGQRYVTAFAQTKGEAGWPNPRWIVLARQPVKEAYAVADRLSHTLLAGSATALAALLALASLQLQRLTKPLEEIAQHAQTIAAGAPIRDLPPAAGPREVIRLTTALDAMLHTLNAQQAELSLAAKVFSNSLQGIMITDAQARILRVNPAFVTITGFSPQECINKTPAILKSGRHNEAFYRTLWQSLTKQGSWSGEIWNRHKNGTIYPEWLSISAVRSDDGQISHYIGIFTDITEQKQQQERITHLATHDALTDLPNRTLLKERTDALLAQARDQRQMVAFLFIDLDLFKHINDTFGHLQGDELLVQVADRLRRLSKEHELVARMGGDEFIMIVAGDHVLAAERARAILAAFAEPFSVADRVVRITSSIGISLFPKDGQTADDLLRHADVALYQAKKTRNTFCFHSQEMTQQSMERLHLEQALRDALPFGQLHLAYQPQVRLDDGSVVGVEALLRWTHPELGAVSPARFIPIAEETGLIGPISHWVMRTACGQMQQWRQTYGVDWRVAVNVSAVQLEDRSFCKTARQVLTETALPAHALEVEITESLMMTNNPTVWENISHLRALGVNLALDDFGTGYSNLKALTELPIDVLKIDKRFIDTITDLDHKGDVIARLTIEIAKELGMTPVAEGVEHKEQAIALHHLGCTIVQGYYSARPLPAAEIEARYFGTGK